MLKRYMRDNYNMYNVVLKYSAPDTSHMIRRETEITTAKKFNGGTACDRGGGVSDKSSNDVR